MTGFPAPQPGLVISYSYLWSDEAAEGRVEGRKDRPCAIVIALEALGDRSRTVAVVPITHSAPPDPNVAVEIPLRVKEHLGLDGERSWIMLNEMNVFRWPGFDLRPIARDENRVDYGFLPPRFFDSVIEKLTRLINEGEVEQTSRDEWDFGGLQGTSFSSRISNLLIQRITSPSSNPSLPPISDIAHQRRCSYLAARKSAGGFAENSADTLLNLRPAVSSRTPEASRRPRRRSRPR